MAIAIFVGAVDTANRFRSEVFTGVPICNQVSDDVTCHQAQPGQRFVTVDGKLRMG